MSDLYARLQEAVANAAGLSVSATLSTLDGSEHLLPPTYADAAHRHNMTEPDAQGVSAWAGLR